MSGCGGCFRILLCQIENVRLSIVSPMIMGILLPAICQWEAQMLHRKKRIALPLPFPTWLRRATSADMLTILPLGAETVIAVNELPDSFHGDPADRIIVATARSHDIHLATHDEAIRRSRLVKLWKP